MCTAASTPLTMAQGEKAPCQLKYSSDWKECKWRAFSMARPKQTQKRYRGFSLWKRNTFRTCNKMVVIALFTDIHHGFFCRYLRPYLMPFRIITRPAPDSHIQPNNKLKRKPLSILCRGTIHSSVKLYSKCYCSICCGKCFLCVHRIYVFYRLWVQ